MIFGTLVCTACGIVVSPVDPNGGERICLDCCNWHGKEECCNECGSNNTQRMLHQSGKPCEVCPKCKKGVLHFCI
jgi:hypothetical protein